MLSGQSRIKFVGVVGQGIAKDDWKNLRQWLGGYLLHWGFRLAGGENMSIPLSSACRSL